MPILSGCPPRWTPPLQSNTGDDWQEIIGAEDVKCEGDKYLQLTVPPPPDWLTRVWRGVAQDKRQWAQSNCQAGNFILQEGGMLNVIGTISSVNDLKSDNLGHLLPPALPNLLWVENTCNETEKDKLHTDCIPHQ